MARMVVPIGSGATAGTVRSVVDAGLLFPMATRTAVSTSKGSHRRPNRTLLEVIASSVVEYFVEKFFQARALRIVEQLLWFTLLDDLSFVDEDQSVPNLAREAHLVGDDQ